MTMCSLRLAGSGGAVTGGSPLSEHFIREEP